MDRTAEELDYSDWAPRRLTHAQARQELLDEGAARAVTERLRVMTELNRRMYALRGIDVADSETDWVASRVQRIRRSFAGR